MKYGINVKIFGTFFLIVIILLGVLVGSIYIVSQNMVTRIITENFNAEMQKQQQDIDGIFAKMQRAGEYINVNQYIYELLTDVPANELDRTETVKRLQQEFTNTYDIFVNDEGALIYQVAFFIGKDLPLAETMTGFEIENIINNALSSDIKIVDDEWFSKIRLYDELTYYYFNKELKKLYIVQMMRSVYEADKNLGEIVLAIDLDGLANSLRGEAEDKYVTFFENGKYIAGDNMLEGSVEEGMVQKTIDGKEYLLSIGRFFGDVYIGNYICEDTAFAELTEFKKMIAVVCLIGIVIAFLLIRRSSYVVTRPILKLAGIMENTDTPGDTKGLTYRKTNDEMDVLYNSYCTMLDKISHLMEENEQAIRKRQETEVTALQLQINPHFLYNVLNSIAIQALGGGNDEIASQLKRISQLLRYNINDMTGEVTVEDEFEFVSMYTDIQKYVYGDGVELDMEVSEEAAGCRIIRCIVQPIVENSILHGDDSGEYKINITVKADIDDGRLVISVADDGNGCNADEINGALGSDAPIRENCVGLLNVSRRIKLTYGEEYGLKYKSSDKGTEVQILLPANRKDEE